MKKITSILIACFLLVTVTSTFSQSGIGTCYNPHIASCGGTYYGNNGTGVNNYNAYYAGSTLIFSQMYGPEVFYQLTMNQSGPLTISLTGMSQDLDLILLSTCSQNSILAYSGNGGNSNELINVSSIPAGTYRIVVDGWNYAVSNYTLAIQCGAGPQGGNGTCSNPYIAACGNTYYGNNANGVNNNNSYSGSGVNFTQMYGPEVFYQLTLNQSGPLNLSLTGLAPGQDLDLIVLSSCNSNTIVAYSGNANNNNEYINVSYLPAGTYRIVVDGWNYSVSNYTLNVQCNVTGCLAPTAVQLFASNVTTISARLNTTYQGATSYDWHYRITGMTSWIDLNTTTVNYVNLNNLTPYATYEFQCLVYCGGAWTVWSSSQYFGTGFPINNETCGAIELATGSSCYPIWGSNVAASTSWNPSPPGNCNTVNMRDVWFKLQVPSTGKVKISTSGETMHNALVSFYTGNCNNLYPVYPYCIDDNANGDMMPDVLVPNLTPGSWLYVRIWGYSGTLGSFFICAETIYGLGEDDPDGAGSRNEEFSTAEKGEKITSENLTIKIFPVPAQDEITISATLATEGDVTIRVLSLAGQVVKEETLAQSPAGDLEKTLDVSGLPSGMYLLRFQAGGLETTSKFMKM